LQQGEQQAKQGQSQQANQNADQANTAMANAMAAMQMASAQAKAAQDAAQKSGQSQQAALAPGKGQGQQPGQDSPPGQPTADAQGKSDSQSEQPAEGTSAAKDPKYGNAGDGSPDGARADVRGNGQYLGLPPRDRQAVQQSQGEKYPQEYGSMVEQYYRNLSDASKGK
jgi:hypothetical protein